MNGNQTSPFLMKTKYWVESSTLNFKNQRILAENSLLNLNRRKHIILRD